MVVFRNFVALRSRRGAAAMTRRLPLVALAAAVIVITALPVGQSAPSQPPQPAPPAVERFDKMTDCPALRLRYSQAHAIWKRSVRAGQEDHTELAAMRGTLRRLEQLGDCLQVN
jgi:hypothetical protein